ncbi:hypothetical protein [Microbacterium sp. No. 7]|nr:hypothetical protein [Microbacterium sp. No. 7]
MNPTSRHAKAALAAMGVHLSRRQIRENAGLVRRILESKGMTTC